MSETKRKVPKLRFPGFTEDWEQRKLGEVAEIVRGASPRPIADLKWFDNKSDIGWLRISDVTSQDGRIKSLEQRISKLGQEKTRVLMTPHLLLSIAATVGKPVINYVPTGVHDGFLIFMNPKFNIIYAFWWLEMFREKWNRYGQPGSQVNLNSELVKNQEISLPSDEEQIAISSFFENFDNLITLHQRKLGNLKLKKKALLQKLFPKNGEQLPELRFPGFTDAWEQRKLGEVVERVSCTSEDSEIPQVEYEDIISGEGRLNKDITKKLSNKKGILFRKGDVLYGKLRPYLKNWLLPDFSGKAVGDFWVLRSEKVQSSFLYNLIQSNRFELASNQSTGTKMPRADWNLVANTEFPVPVSIEEQISIGNIFKLLNNSITLHQRKLEHLQLQKKALLQQMFV